MASEKESSGTKNEKIEKWREIMDEMSVKDLLKIKFCYNKLEEWQLMYSPYQINKKWFCSLCRKVLGDGNSVKAHNSFNKHRSSLETKVYDICHETIDPFKSSEKEEKKSSEKEEKKSSEKENKTESHQNVEIKKECLTEKEFKNKLFDLTLAEILEVQYKLDNFWKQLIISLQKGYNCTICKSNLLTNIQGIRNHMSNRQHVSNMNLIEGIHHPTYFPVREIVKKKDEQTNKVNKTSNSAGKQIAKEIIIDDVQDPKTDQNVGIQKIGPIQVSIKSIEKKTREVIDITDQNEKKSKNSEPEPIVSKNDQSQNQVTKKNPELETITLSKNEQPQNQLTKKTINEFLNEMTSMRKEDLLNVEYKGNDRKWRHIIVQSGAFFTCEICNVRQLKDIPLSDHIKGKKHKEKAYINVVRFFHPIFTEPKDLNQKINDNVDGEQISNTSAKNKPDNTTSAKITDIPVLTKTTDSLASNKTKDISAPTKATVNPVATKTAGKTIASPAPIKVIEKQTPIKKIDIPVLKNKPEVIIAESNDIEVVTVEDSPERELVPPGTEPNAKNVVLNPIAVGQKNNKSINAANNNKSNQVPTISNNNKSNPVPTLSNNNKNKNIPQPIEKRNKPNDKIITNKNKQSFEKKEFTTKLYEEVEGFVGIEYVIKIIKHATDNDPRFECCLCELELNGFEMQSHLKGLTHRLKYLERHFSTCMRQFKNYRGNNSIMHQITERICKSIEKYHGRDLPLECVQNDYRSNRRDYMEKVFSFRHASEMSGPSFTNIISKDELQNIVKNKDHKISERNDNKITFTVRDNQRKPNYPFTTESDHRPTQKISNIPTRSAPPIQNHSRILHHQRASYGSMYDSVHPNNIVPFEQANPNYSNSYNVGFYPEMQPRQNAQYEAPATDQFLDNEEHRRLAEKFVKNTKMNNKHDRYHRQSSRSPRRHRRSRSRSRNRRDMRSVSKSPLREGDFWQAYRRKFDIDIKIINMDFEQYRKDPQSHPSYNEEWQTFWANRINELKQAGRDDHNHDFTYEWSLYFPKRLEELYEKEVEGLKIRLRERFVLPMHNHDLRDSRYHIKNIFESNIGDLKAPAAPNFSSPNKSKQDYKGNSPPNQRGRSNVLPRQDTASQVSKRKSISVEKNFNEYDDMDIDMKNAVDESLGKKRKKLRSRSRSISPVANDDLEKELDNDTLTAMSVLRVLTALEDNLGTSLGPKIIDLMSKALVLEKTKPNAVDENLLNTENCLLLETCREKLKGQIVAGLYKSQQLRAVKDVIKNITEIVTKAGEYRAKQTEKQFEVQNILKKAVTGSIPPKFSAAPRPPAKTVPKQSTSNIRTAGQSSYNYGSNIDAALTSSSNSTGTTAKSKQSNVPTMSMNQKKELAKKLAQALAAQGKTDISTENCEQLIEVYTLIDKKQQESGKLSTEEKSLSECLQDCIKTGSLNNLTTLIQDKGKDPPTQESQQQHQLQLSRISSQVQSILMSMNQKQTPNLTPRAPATNNYGGFAHLANFDTSLNFNTPVNLNRPFRGGTSDITGSGQFRGGSSDITGSGQFRGGTSDVTGSGSFRGGTSDVTGSGSFRGGTSDVTGSGPFRGGTSDVTGSGPFRGATSDVSGSGGHNNSFNSPAQNWVQGSVLSGPNIPNTSSLNTSIGSYSAFSTNNQMSSLNPDMNSFNRNASGGGNWQRSDYNSPSQQQNPYQNQNQYSGGSLYGRYGRR